MPKPSDYRSVIRPPWTIKIEQSYGCNLKCGFCPIANIPEINLHKQFMRPYTCEQIVAQAVELKYNLRVELTLRGEPTLNPQILDNLSIMRRVAPKFQISMFTNGVNLLTGKVKIKDLLDAGVNILCIDCYNGTYDRFFEFANGTGERIVDFRDFSAYKKHPHGHTMRVVNLVPDIQEGAVDVRKIHNNAGNVSQQYLDSLKGYEKKSLPLVKGCARPFRELVVYNDGSVVICCHDWKAECVLGNVFEETLTEIWYGEKHWQILKDLYEKKRDRVPCCKCDYSGGYRLGLLQNPTKTPHRFDPSGVESHDSRTSCVKVKLAP